MWITQELADAIRAWDQLANSERRRVCRELRRVGLTYAEIARVVPVAQGTLSAWVRDIELTPWQQESIRLRTSQKGRPRDTQRQRREQVARIREEAVETAYEFADDPDFVAGVMLYWAEGTKARPGLELTNTDPALLRIFIRWTREYLEKDAVFVLSLHLHEGLDEEAAKDYWRKQLGLHEAQFTATYWRPIKQARKRRLAHGICRVRVRRSTDLWHETMGFIEALRYLAA